MPWDFAALTTKQKILLYALIDIQIEEKKKMEREMAKSK